MEKKPRVLQGRETGHLPRICEQGTLDWRSGGQPWDLQAESELLVEEREGSFRQEGPSCKSPAVGGSLGKASGIWR